MGAFLSSMAVGIGLIAGVLFLNGEVVYSIDYVTGAERTEYYFGSAKMKETRAPGSTFERVSAIFTNLSVRHPSGEDWHVVTRRKMNPFIRGGLNQGVTVSCDLRRIEGIVHTLGDKRGGIIKGNYLDILNNHGVWEASEYINRVERENAKEIFGVDLAQMGSGESSDGDRSGSNPKTENSGAGRGPESVDTAGPGR